jgi:peptide/nickel transport system permease protein
MKTFRTTARRGIVKITFYRLLEIRSGVFGLIITSILIFTAIFADVLSPYDPFEMSVRERLEHPSTRHPMGTDQVGRDLLSRVIHGSRISILVGVMSVLFAILVGVPLGLLAGYREGKFDTVIMRIMEIMLSFPVFLLAMIIVVVLKPGVTNVCIALGIVNVPVFARLTRGSVLSIKQNDYVRAVRILGLHDARIMLFHVLPNCLPEIIVTASTVTAFAIISEAGLSFLGIGTQPPTPSWGYDLKANLRFIEINPWLSIFPGLAIFVTSLAFNMLGDAIRDALNPRLKKTDE